MKKKVLLGLIVAIMTGCFLAGCGSEKIKQNVDLSSFSSTDMNGNEVTQDIFKDYDVTMVNVFTSWCQYCIEEMPYIEKMYEGLDSNVNVVGICMDAASEKETVEQEIAETKLTYPVIVDNDQIHDLLDDSLSGYPTTFFVDSEGHLIDGVDPVVGAPGNDESSIIKAYQEKIQEALDAVGAK